MENRKEIWVNLTDLYNKYSVSNLGRVKSFKQNEPIILKIFKCGNYLGVNLILNNGCRKRMLTHRLVAMAFLGYDINSKLVIDHINDNPSDNNVENLQILSHRENISKGFKKLNTSSKYTGVRFKDNAYEVNITINKKTYYLGRFKDEYKAHLAYQKKLKQSKNG